MTRPLRIHLPGKIYHVYSRGNNRAPLFRNDDDRRLFLKLLDEMLPRFDSECVFHCLMGNHDHLLVRVNSEPISRLMQQLNSSYCQQFNRRHDRVGHVTQGRFGSKIVDDGEYARTVIRYLALNPVHAGFCAAPEEWLWSSYHFALGLTAPPAFLALPRIWNAFGTSDPSIGRARLIHFVSAGIEDVFLNPLVHGSSALAARVAPLLEPVAFHREYVRAHKHALRPSLGDLFAGRFERVEIEDAAYEAYQRHSYTLADIGAMLGRAPSTIWRWIDRAKARRKNTGGDRIQPHRPHRRTFAEKSRPDPV